MTFLWLLSTTLIKDNLRRLQFFSKVRFLKCFWSLNLIRFWISGLSRAQLLDVLNELVAKRPEIEEDLRQCLPKPDLGHMEEKLNYLKRNIFKALPNTRLESKTDSMAYQRVAQHLVVFKKELIDQGKLLTDANAWPSLVDHSIMAWNFVAATPTWDNAPHNNVKKQCFKALAANLNMALKKGSWTEDTSINIKNK